MPVQNRIFFRTQVTPYVILFIERDGSTYLTSLLMSHPDVAAVYERFAVMRQNGASAQDQIQWADNFFTPSLINRYAAVGFKTKLVDVIDIDGFTALLRRKNVHIIHMQRHNRVKAVVSRVNARRLYEASGKWNLYSETDRLPPAAIDLDEFRQFLKEREQADAELEAYVRELGLPAVKIVYEDLQTDKTATLEKVFHLLKLRKLPLEGKTLKNTQDDLRKAVLNYDELREYYKGTGYEAMFDEVLA